MRKICFLLGGFQGSGGIGRSTSIIANYFSNSSDLEVHTICYCETSKKRMYTISPMVREHILFNTNISMTKALIFNHTIKRVKNIVKENGIDVLIACGSLFYPLGILSVKGTPAKCICVEHTSPDVETDYKFQVMCRKLAAKKADMVVTLTDSAKEYYIKTLGINGKRVCRIYNPVPKEYYQSKKYNVETKKIISVGRLSYPKNFSRLIDIAKTVFERHPDWCWDIYGEGEERARLQQKIETLGLINHVKLRGQVSDLLLRYENYSFIVMTSRYEGFPMSLLEASANRLPLVSFDIKTGPSEIIKNNVNGYLLNSGDTNGMIDKICKLIENNAIRSEMSQKSYESSFAFGMKEINKQWQEVFEEITST